MVNESIVLLGPSILDGSVRAPPSKSYSHRAFFASLLARGESTIVNPLWSNDTATSLAAIRALGAQARRIDNALRVVSDGARGLRWAPVIYVAESGTTMRLVTALLGLLDKPVLVYGRGRIHERPVKGLLEALGSLGAEYIVSRGCCPPHVVKGPVRGSHVKVDARESSQYVSALLMLGAGLGELDITVTNLESKPYVDITIRVLEAYGVSVEREDYRWFHVVGEPVPVTYVVPGDWSSAAALLAAGAVAGHVRVEGLDPADPQPDKAITYILRSMGAGIRVRENYAEAWSTGRLEGFETRIQDYPDLGPVLAALAAIACGYSRICCAERLRLKESDRVEAILDLMRRSGVDSWLEEGDKGLCIVVRGACGRLRGGVVYDVHGDHRVAMAAAILGLASAGETVIRNPGVVAKSFPGFWDALKKLGARIVEEK
ncbi:3-phosphoshikimate 1-carboxyvinyltransferase [Pyrofollis japonicus]|uniref:3-phosphoshikimate 1-carboxyvinyltransferase n=1 Tax=Pyrofollis japonicus TaxID=3060460 RepID=UPI00295B449B|nr:3-phosphoshikimate 1-carboxyvinyltransferase [Pyrofollis japonicus]BEP17814.1 3-phosphoshikimate 1-carboxyvinyltransferase [Pyrofollis japonicus]